MSNHTIKSIYVDSPTDCALECTAILKCKSFNFKVIESVENNCELNDATRTSSYPSDYKETTGLVYYEATPEVSRYQILISTEPISLAFNDACTKNNHNFKPFQKID